MGIVSSISLVTVLQYIKVIAGYPIIVMALIHTRIHRSNGNDRIPV